MRIIGPPNMESIRVQGRDIIEVPRTKKSDEETIVAMKPLSWLMPSRTAAGGIAFGAGVSYYTGEKPTNYDSIFTSGKRICLVETLTPTSAYYTFNDGALDHEALKVVSVDRQAEIMEIPAPYQSSVSTIQNGEGVPEIRITVLGYSSASLGMAIGEKIRFTDDAGINPDYVAVERYPYIIGPIAGYSAADSENAEKYYYSEAEILEDL